MRDAPHLETATGFTAAGLLLFAPLAIVGFILSISSLIKMHREGGTENFYGSGWIIASMVISSIVVAGIALVIALLAIFF